MEEKAMEWILNQGPVTVLFGYFLWSYIPILRKMNETLAAILEYMRVHEGVKVG
jgi:hypothetical protein